MFVFLFSFRLLKSGLCEDPNARGRGEVEYGGVEVMLGQNSACDPCYFVNSNS